MLNIEKDSKDPTEPTTTENEVLQKFLEESLIGTRIRVDMSLFPIFIAELTLTGLNKHAGEILNMAPSN